MQYEEFRVHSTANKSVSLPFNHELEVSNSFNIQTDCSVLRATSIERATAATAATS